jgi:hypothetical protein
VWTLAVLWTKAPAWELKIGIGHWGWRECHVWICLGVVIGDQKMTTAFVAEADACIASL